MKLKSPSRGLIEALPGPHHLRKKRTLAGVIEFLEEIKCGRVKINILEVRKLELLVLPFILAEAELARISEIERISERYQLRAGLSLEVLHMMGIANEILVRDCRSSRFGTEFTFKRALEYYRQANQPEKAESLLRCFGYEGPRYPPRVKPNFP
ncbi:hypothetical protein HYV84_01330 [Candidatus Woesearchaeota archaeon]|nr:hypothetical protein [Candidatus Woesearchaeota archaeon]